MNRYLVAVLCWWCAAAQAGQKDLNTERQIVEAMQRNFAACNSEDITAVMESCADAMPDRGKFRKETLETFREKDIHYSLVACELLQVRLPYASARIVQDTHVGDPESKTPCQAAYRNNTALIPNAQRVEYINTFKKEKGRWKLYLVVSEMKKVGKEPQAPGE